MESEINQESFGDYLKAFRIQRELTLETVAAKTKIAVHCLRSIEGNAHDQLPPPAYVRGFIRTYAQAIGANTDVAVNLYLSDLDRQENVKQKHLKRRAKLGAVRRTLMAVVAIVSILLLLRYTDIGPDREPQQRTPEHQGTDRSTPPAAGATISGRMPAAATIPNTLRLKVISVEQTWLKVIVDGHHARSYNLKPGDQLELEGTNNFNLMIGNATGLKILLDDRPVKIFGSSGQVVSLKIP